MTSQQTTETLSQRLESFSDRIDQQQQAMLDAMQDLRDEITVLAAQLEQVQSQNEAAAEESSSDGVAPPMAAVEMGESFEEEPAAPTPVAAVPEMATPVAVQAYPPAAPAPVIVGDDKLEEIIFGDQFGSIPYLEPDRKELIRGLLSGDETAMALAGQMLIFRAANVETMPQLLKALGEAYYEWRPQAARQADPMRDALIEELHRACEAVGVNHRIELAQPGDRFENKRHSSKQRGVEVTDVHGWIVLRDNGSVYTKANVSVQ